MLFILLTNFHCLIDQILYDSIIDFTSTMHHYVGSYPYMITLYSIYFDENKLVWLVCCVFFVLTYVLQNKWTNLLKTWLMVEDYEAQELEGFLNIFLYFFYIFRKLLKALTHARTHTLSLYSRLILHYKSTYNLTHWYIHLTSRLIPNHKSTYTSLQRTTIPKFLSV